MISNRLEMVTETVMWFVCSCTIGVYMFIKCTLQPIGLCSVLLSQLHPPSNIHIHITYIHIHIHKHTYTYTYTYYIHIHIYM